MPELHNKNTTLVKDIIIGMSDGFILFRDNHTAFNLSGLVTILALIIFGFFKSKVTGKPLLKGTIKVALIGIIAAGAAFLLAKAVS
jgi:VIT1/CCC1 family predicted Fe2+/Mn2+ transporter